MKIQLILILTCYISLMNACVTSEKSLQVSTLDFKIIENVTFDTINIPILIGYPQGLHVAGNYLIIEDYFQRENGLYIINKETKQLHSQGMKKGRGPGETISPSFNLITSPNKKEVNIFEPNLKKIIYYDYSLPSELALKHEEHITNPSLDQSFILECFRTNNYYIGLGKEGLFNSSRFILFNKDTVKQFAEYPNLKDYINTDTDIKDIIYYQTWIKPRPDRKKVAIATYIGALLEIFDISQIPHAIHKDTAILVYPPTLSKGNISTTANTIIGFEDVYVTDKYIYTLINGCTSENYTTLPKEICVFDWEGHSIKKYKTDIELKSIAIDEEDQVIYAIALSQSEEFILIKIPMNN